MKVSDFHSRENQLAMKQICWLNNNFVVNRTFVLALKCLQTGMLLSQIVYWFSPSKHTNKMRASIVKDGRIWIAKRRKDWWNECFITPKQFDKSIKKLKELGIVYTKVYKYKAVPTLHISLNFIRLKEIIDEFAATAPDIEQGEDISQRDTEDSTEWGCGENPCCPDGNIGAKNTPRRSPNGKVDVAQMGTSIKQDAFTLNLGLKNKAGAQKNRPEIPNGESAHRVADDTAVGDVFSPEIFNKQLRQNREPTRETIVVFDPNADGSEYPDREPKKKPRSQNSRKSRPVNPDVEDMKSTFAAEYRRKYGVEHPGLATANGKLSAQFRQLIKEIPDRRTRVKMLELYFDHAPDDGSVWRWVHQNNHSSSCFFASNVQCVLRDEAIKRQMKKPKPRKPHALVEFDIAYKPALGETLYVDDEGLVRAGVYHIPDLDKLVERAQEFYPDDWEYALEKALYAAAKAADTDRQSYKLAIEVYYAGILAIGRMTIWDSEYTGQLSQSETERIEQIVSEAFENSDYDYTPLTRAELEETVESTEAAW